MEEVIQEEKRRKRYRHMVCEVCGHEWRSYGYGERIKCPACAERVTGKKLGCSPEQMATVRAARKKKAIQQENTAPVITPEPKQEKPPEGSQEAQGGFFSRLLNKEVF